MTEYTRPALPQQVFYDNDGAVINYGNRWPNHVAPEDTYSVDSHPERFAPLHTVAEALIDYLRNNYSVTITEDVSVASDLMHQRDDVSRAVRLAPANDDGAPLTFVFTSYPSVIIHGGLLRDFLFPTCGCDACDDSAEGLVEELEEIVFGVVSGGYSESVSPLAQLNVGYSLEYGNSRRRGNTAEHRFPERVAQAEARLRQLPNGWQPWRRLGSP